MNYVNLQVKEEKKIKTRPRMADKLIEDYKKCYGQYIKNLEQWCDSEYSHPKVKAVFVYLKKRTLIQDLIEAKVLFVGKDNKLLEKWDGDDKEKPTIFKQNAKDVSDKGVRFSVEILGDLEPSIWKDHDVSKAYILYYQSQLKNQGLCYVSGQNKSLIEKHPKNINRFAANAKLISANDETNFTFRGRFLVSSQAVSVGYETSQKAHQALRWLINSRGYLCGTQAIVTWAIDSDVTVPDFHQDSYDIYKSVAKTESEKLIEIGNITFDDYAKWLNSAFASAGKLDRLKLHTRHVAVMAVDVRNNRADGCYLLSRTGRKRISKSCG